MTKLEEQTKWMYDRMTAAAESSTWNKVTSWKHEDHGDEWQRWERKLMDSGQSRRLELWAKEKDIKESEEDD